MYFQPQKPDEIFHYGIKRRSGRYPYGSGERPYQDIEKKNKRLRSNALDAMVNKQKIESISKKMMINKQAKIDHPELKFLFPVVDFETAIDIHNRDKAIKAVNKALDNLEKELPGVDITYEVLYDILKEYD